MKDILLSLAFCVILAMFVLMKNKVEIQEAEMKVLSTKFDTKVEYLDELSGRKPRVMTLQEEMEIMHRESNGIYGE